jgi:hypothetical protein
VDDQPLTVAIPNRLPAKSGARELSQASADR